MPSDTFKFIPANMLPSPGTCCICTSNLRGCIDFGITLDYFGAVLFCTQCVIELTKVEELGLVRRVDVEDALSENAILNSRDELLNTELGVAQNGVVAVLNHFSDILRKSRSVSGILATDTETTGIDFYGSDET